MLISLIIGNTSDRGTSEFLRGLGIYLKNEKLHRIEASMDTTENFWQGSVFILLLVRPSFYYISFLSYYSGCYSHCQFSNNTTVDSSSANAKKETGIDNITEKIKKHNIQINEIFHLWNKSVCCIAIRFRRAIKMELD